MKRSTIQMKMDILSVCYGKHVILSHIVQKANVNGQSLTKLISELIAKDLLIKEARVIERIERITYRSTGKGIHALNTWKMFKDIVG